MKELNIEEKAKAYDNAIERARKIHNEHKAQPFDVMLKVFPELKESVKIKKDIISFFNSSKYQILKLGVSHQMFDSWIAWLEKQDEQKHAEWSEHQHKLLNYAISMTDDTEVKRFLESLRNAGSNTSAAWSEEDEEKINSICNIIADKMFVQKQAYKSYYKNLIDWLKSLRPQTTWKPSEGQMEA